MSRQAACCCGTGPEPEVSFCCEPWLKDQFVSIYSLWMDSALPVSATDLIVLRINRPSSRSHGTKYAFRTTTDPGNSRPCHTCCTSSCAPYNAPYVNPCEVCEPCGPIGAVCPFGTCKGNNACCFCSSTEKSEICGDTVPCCRVCDNGNFAPLQYSTRRSDKKDETEKLFIANLAYKGIFKAPVNRVLSNPPSLLSSYKPMGLEELNAISILGSQPALIQASNTTPTTSSGIEFADPDSIIEVTTQDPNAHFKNQLEVLYPACKKCMEDHGYDLDCFRGYTAPEKCKDNIASSRYFCQDCQDECAAFCEAYYGDTWTQKSNAVEFFGSEVFNDNYQYLQGSTVLDPQIYLGTKIVTSRIKEMIDPLRESLIIRGDEYDKATNEPTARTQLTPVTLKPSEISKKVKADFGKSAGDTTVQLGDVPMNIAYTRLTGSTDDGVNNLGDIDTNPGGGGAGSGSGGVTTECDVCSFHGRAPGATPLYLIYRYSGCYIRWYPPEYIFNYNVKVSQGSGYANRGQFWSCDYLIRSPNGPNGAGWESMIETSCELNETDGVFNQVGCGGLACDCRTPRTFPCDCFSYPHISGGLADTVKKKFNVSQKEKQGGYIPFNNPFAPRMRVSESGCMACANRNSTQPVGSGACDPYFDFRRNQAAFYPVASNKGKGPPILGAWCNWEKNTFTPEGWLAPYYNPSYGLDCFRRGLSPYLSRISKTEYQAAREIFYYGSAIPSEQESLGPFYTGGSIGYVMGRFTSLTIAKRYNKRDLLYNQMIGLVSIEYHFECWAYHSKSLFATMPPITFNHSTALNTPFERPYAGQWAPTWFKYDPREAFRFYAMRHYPRRVMYGSSAVPIFHSDLHAMETLTRFENVVFNARKFLSAFYLYFYNVLKDAGDTLYNEPYVNEEDKNTYEYVSYWLKEMIRRNILSVKDHAPDIANDVIDVMSRVTKVTDDTTTPPTTVYVFPDETVKAMLGGEVGYVDMFNWIKNAIRITYPNVTLPPDSELKWSDMEPYVTAKLIKEHLINPEQYTLSNPTNPDFNDFKVSMPIFAGPRRARLWPTPQTSGLTAWGCKDASECIDPDRRRSVESALNVNTSVIYQRDDNTYGRAPANVEYWRLFSGQEAYFAVTGNGKVRVFGFDPPSGAQHPSGLPLTREDIGAFPDFPVQGVVKYNDSGQDGGRDIDVYMLDGLNCATDALGVDFPPEHLTAVYDALNSLDIDDSSGTVDLPDGYVEKICNKGKFAAALVSYDEGSPLGASLFECRKLSYTYPESPRGWNANFDRDPAGIVMDVWPQNNWLPQAFVPQIPVNCSINILKDPPAPLTRQILAVQRSAKFSNSGVQVPGTCLVSFDFGLPVFQSVQTSSNACTPPYNNNCSTDNDIGSQEFYTIKVWGERGYGLHGVFLHDNCNLQGEWVLPMCAMRNGGPVDVFKPVHYMANKFFCWKDVACGAKHMIAITTEGALFATPYSMNDFNQSEYGFPTLDGKRYYKEPQDCYGHGGTMGIYLDDGVRAMNWYYHFPKPAYFTDEEWYYLTYRNTEQLQEIRLSNAGDIYNDDGEPISLVPESYRDTYPMFSWRKCERHGNFAPNTTFDDGPPDANGNSIPDPNARRQETIIPCDIRCHLFTVASMNDRGSLDNGQINRFFPGRLQDPSDRPAQEEPRDPDLDCEGPYGYSCAEIIPDAPVWKSVAAGHYHSMALGTDNQLKMWGKWVYVDSQGEPIFGSDPYEAGNAIDVRLPVNEVFQDHWTLSGWTLGCGWGNFEGMDRVETEAPWKGADNPNESCDELVFDEWTNQWFRPACFNDAQKQKFMVATEANKTVFSSKEILFIDGGPDYSVLVRKGSTGESPGGRPSHKLVVWGNPKMVEGVNGACFGTALIAQDSKFYNEIEKITAGPNAIAVLYRPLNGMSTRLDIIPRPGVDLGLTGFNPLIEYQDVALTTSTAAALFASGIQINTWKQSSFDTNTHSKLQFRNFSSLPIFFQSQAFFSAVPGTWDFSKWIFGGPCNAVGTEMFDTIINTEDPCSIYQVKDPENGRLLSYSGFPYLYWMRPDFRRNSPATPTWSYEPSRRTGCGLVRDRAGRDGLNPTVENGTGAIGGDYDSPVASANRALVNGYGSCWGGDSCWVGDGSFSPFPYVPSNPNGGMGVAATGCKCWSACSCPPLCRSPIRYACFGGGFQAVECFQQVYNRNGYTSNKDYFVQSSKAFGTLSTAGDGFSAQCCGVVMTNITAFFYAKRSFYYAYDPSTQCFRVKRADENYTYRAASSGERDLRGYYNYGNTSPTPWLNPNGTYNWSGPVPVEEAIWSDLSNEPGGIGPGPDTRDPNFYVEAMAPYDAINKLTFLVNDNLEYPPVYCGSGSLLPLEKSIQARFNGDGTNPSCNPCECDTNDPNCSDVGSFSSCNMAVSKVLGPGGWVYARRRPGNDNNPNDIVLNGFNVNNSSVLYIRDKIPKSLLPRTGDSLGPLLKIKQFEGPVPAVMGGCSFYRDTTGQPLPDGQTCGCNKNVYPNGVCPGGAVSCPGCMWRPLLGSFGGVSFSNTYFTLDGSTGLDILDAYFDNNILLPRPPVIIPAGEDDDMTQTTEAEMAIWSESITNKLYRIYSIIPSLYSVCGDGFTSIPKDFESIEDPEILDNPSTNAGTFRATCNNIFGRVSSIEIDDPGLQYLINDIVTVETLKFDPLSPPLRLRVSAIEGEGNVTALDLVPNTDSYLMGTFGTTGGHGVNLRVTIGTTGPVMFSAIGRVLPIECFLVDE